MIDWLLWYLTITISGWLIIPLMYRLFPALADRGYTFSRTLGLLLWGFIFWLLSSLGILSNQAGSILMALVILIAVSIGILYKSGLSEIRQWLLAHTRYLLGVEILFMVAMAGMALIRSTNPEALGTEKPMELAFINAILNSPTFPPHDPWLSGYAISYYYFGYILVAMLAKLCGTAGGLAFNLGLSLVFGLSATGAYGLVYNLLYHSRNVGEQPAYSRRAIAGWPFLGSLFILFVSNLEGFLHMLHTRGLFWSKDAAGGWSSSFWSWLDIKDLNLPPDQPFQWIPTRFWWWWRASRVLQDYDFSGSAREIINEFPFFSYLLADLHPHVLAMPFMLLAISLALNVFFGGATGQGDRLTKRLNTRLLLWATLLTTLGSFIMLYLGLVTEPIQLSKLALGGVGLLTAAVLFWFLVPDINQYGWQTFSSQLAISTEVWIPFNFQPTFFLVSAITLGGMAFMNTWDFPVTVALFAMAYGLKNRLDRYRAPEDNLEEEENIRSAQGWPGVIRDIILMGLALGISGILLYLPFYLGFASQAGGIIPSQVFFTRGAHFWVMFTPLLLPIIGLLIYLLKKQRGWRDLWYGAGLSILLVTFLASFMLLLTYLAVKIPEIGDLFLSILNAPNASELIKATILRRLAAPGAWLTIIALLSATISLLMKKKIALPDGFVVLLMLVGTLLVLAPEFFYLRDQFGWRMNTIFKFYYQAWLVWGIAAAYAAGRLALEIRQGWGVVLRTGLVILLVMSLVYPVLGVWSKTNGFNAPEKWTLDSTAYLQGSSPDEMDALRWLSAAPAGVVAEAVSPTGGSYTGYGRVAMISGKPAVLGWIGHESQWRGGYQEIGSRQSDMEKLYCSKNWEETQAILDQYQVHYIYVGSLERTTYTANGNTCPTGLYEVKFTRYLHTVFQQGPVTIFEVPKATQP